MKKYQQQESTTKILNKKHKRICKWKILEWIFVILMALIISICLIFWGIYDPTAIYLIAQIEFESFSNYEMFENISLFFSYIGTDIEIWLWFEEW